MAFRETYWIVRDGLSVEIPSGSRPQGGNKVMSNQFPFIFLRRLRLSFRGGGGGVVIGRRGSQPRADWQSAFASDRRRSTGVATAPGGDGRAFYFCLFSGRVLLPATLTPPPPPPPTPPPIPPPPPRGCRHTSVRVRTQPF